MNAYPLTACGKLNQSKSDVTVKNGIVHMDDTVF